MSTFAQYPPVPTAVGGVISVNGQVGVVVLTGSDLSLGPTDNVTFNSLTLSNLTANRAVVTDASKKLVSSATTDVQIGYLSTTTSDVQTQINGKQAAGNYITALTGDVSASGPGSATATLASVGTAGTYVKVDTDAKGRVTSGSASPQLIADGGTGQTTKAAAFDALSPMTTQYDLIVGGASGTGTRLAKGANNTHLTTQSGVVAWTADPTPYSVSTINSNTSAVSGTTYLTDTSGGAFNVTLPTPVSGAFIIIKDKTGSFGTNNLSLLQNAAEKIEGLAATKILQTNWGSWSFFSDGTDWYMGPF